MNNSFLLCIFFMIPSVVIYAQNNASPLNNSESDPSVFNAFDEPCNQTFTIPGNITLFSNDITVSGNGNWKESPFRWAGATIGISDDTMTIQYEDAIWKWKNSRPNDPFQGLSLKYGKQPIPVHSSEEKAEINAITSTPCWFLYKAAPKNESVNKNNNTNIVSTSSKKSLKYDNEEVCYTADKMPKFQGGNINDFKEWIQKNIVYPEITKENNITGRVYVEFEVNSRGEIVNISVILGIDPGLDQEACRVINSSPDWDPGIKDGQPVKVEYTIPVIFKINTDN